MRKLLLPLALVATLGGCAANSQARRVETPVNVTHEVAFGDYRRVYNTTYHIVNRYGVVQKSSYRYGEITALISEDNSLFDKTRRMIQARIVDNGDYWDVQCRVLIAVEDSEVATFDDQFQPLYNWKTVSSDSQLEVRLNNEIRAALSGGAWEAKQPLTPKATSPAAPSKQKARAKSDDEGEVSDTEATPRVAQQGMLPGAEEYERFGIECMRRSDFAAAGRAFQASLQSERGKAAFAHFLLAQARFSQGEFDSALASVEKGTQANTQWGKADLDVREFYAEGSETFTQRLRELESATAADETLTLLLGYMRYFSGDAEGSLGAFDSYLSEYPGNEVAISYRRLARAKVDEAHGLEDF